MEVIQLENLSPHHLGRLVEMLTLLRLKIRNLKSEIKWDGSNPRRKSHKLYALGQVGTGTVLPVMLNFFWYL